LAPLTDAIGYGLLPTPSTSTGGANNKSEAVLERGHGLNLQGALKMFPTPSARDWKGDVSGEATLLKRMEHPRGVCLEEFLRRQCLPTPSAGNSHSAGRLDEWGGKNPLRGTDIGRLLLNPLFVEELMGFPLGWTDLGR
jgi:hypothetical protein